MKYKALEALKNKSHEDLSKDLKESREKLQGLKFELWGGKVKNVREIREVKKRIARINTFLNTN